MTEFQNDSHCVTPDCVLLPCSHPNTAGIYPQYKSFAFLKPVSNLTGSIALVARPSVAAEKSEPGAGKGGEQRNSKTVHVVSPLCEGALSCVAFTRGDSRKRARSNAICCRALQEFAAEISEKCARPSGRSRRQRNWRRALVDRSGRAPTKYRGSARFLPARSWSFFLKSQSEPNHHPKGMIAASKIESVQNKTSL